MVSVKNLFRQKTYYHIGQKKRYLPAEYTVVHVVLLDLKGVKLPLYRMAIQHLLTPKGRCVRTLEI